MINVKSEAELAYGYEFDIQLIIDDDIDSEVSFLREDDDYSDIASDACKDLYNKAYLGIVDSTYNICKELGINDFDFSLDEVDVTDNHIYGVFYTDVETDADKIKSVLEPIIDRYRGTASDSIEYAYNTGRTEYAPNLPDTGMPITDYESVDVEVTVDMYDFIVNSAGSIV